MHSCNHVYMFLKTSQHSGLVPLPDEFTSKLKRAKRLLIELRLVTKSEVHFCGIGTRSDPIHFPAMVSSSLQETLPY